MSTPVEDTGKEGKQLQQEHTLSSIVNTINQSTNQQQDGAVNTEYITNIIHEDSRFYHL